MTDTDLVRNVAEKVMGFSCVKTGCPPTRINHRTISPLPENDFEEEWRVWSPLDDWNDCMMAADALWEKFDRTIDFNMIFAEHDDAALRRRCILVAALAAITGGER